MPENIDKTGDQPLCEVSSTGQRPIRVTMAYDDTGEVIYSNPTKAGIFVSMTDLRLEKNGVIEGRQKITFWGNPMGWFYGWDQLKNELADQKIRDKVIDALKSANGTLLLRELYKSMSDDVNSETFSDACREDAITLQPFMEGRPSNSSIDAIFNGENCVLACGYGFKADLFDDGSRFVCPMIRGMNPGSGRLDVFLDALIPALGKPLAFTNFTNEKLRAHLERRGITCE